VRVVRKDLGRLGLKRSAPRQDRIGIPSAETYAEQFFTDVGVILILLLGLALVVHLIYMTFGS